MIVEEQDIITLDNNNQYVVVSKIKYEKVEYLYLINIFTKEMMFGKLEEDNSITELNGEDDKDLISILIPLFYKKSKKYINN